MKKYFIFLINITFILIFSLTTSCKKKQDEFLKIGIVTGSKLSLRTEPSLKASIIKYLEFGMPLLLNQKSETMQNIDNMRDFWYKEKDSNGWVYGGFLIKTDYDENKIGVFHQEIIRCNVACGGMSCFYTFAAYLFGEYFISSVYINDYPQPGQPCDAIVIGKYSQTEQGFDFSNIIKIGGYFCDKTWVPDLKSKIQSDIYDLILKNYNRKFIKTMDDEGTFYILDGDKKFSSRSKYRNMCKDKDFKKETWVNAYTYDKKIFSEIKSYFPMITSK